MEFTPSPTVEALATKNYITQKVVREITDAVKTAIDAAMQQSAAKDDIFLAGFSAGMNILSKQRVSFKYGNVTQYIELLTREYIATVTK